MARARLSLVVVLAARSAVQAGCWRMERWRREGLGAVGFISVGAASLGYMVCGHGPGLLVPWCNVEWPDLPFFADLAERFTVILAMPRGYQSSSRTRDAGDYGADTLVSDLLAVCDAAGVGDFAVLGYSLTAAMAAWLAGASRRVQAVVAGGFPLLGSYQGVLRGAEDDVVGHDDIGSAEAFDVNAVLAFYQALALVPDGSLVTQAGCRMFAFWGSEDQVLDRFNTARPYEQALRDCGVATAVVQGADHLTGVLRVGELLDQIATWLTTTPPRP